jgi:hypothetical protein
MPSRAASAVDPRSPALRPDPLGDRICARPNQSCAVSDRAEIPAALPSRRQTAARSARRARRGPAEGMATIDPDLPNARARRQRHRLRRADQREDHKTDRRIEGQDGTAVGEIFQYEIAGMLEHFGRGLRVLERGKENSGFWHQNAKHWRAITRPGSDARVVMLRLSKVPQFAAGKHNGPRISPPHRGP